MSYRPNPKTEGSGIICAIPQAGRCPMGCADCFFQSGRSYLEPLEDNLPNLPNQQDAQGRVVRMNDGNDSNVGRETVLAAARRYGDVFFNTSVPRLDFERLWIETPVVLTINPGVMTERNFYALHDCYKVLPESGAKAQCASAPSNLMFVRFRASWWNLPLAKLAVEHWTGLGVPVVMTFMAYHLPPKNMPTRDGEPVYVERKRTLNTYWAISFEAWQEYMDMFAGRRLVYSCGKFEGKAGNGGCVRCGNCLREYFAAKERIRATKAI